MEALLVLPSSKDITAMRDECERLGITFTEGAKLSTLRKKLREYRNQYSLWLRHRDLAHALFGQGCWVDARSATYIVEDISSMLYQRLVDEGFVQVGVDRGKSLYDERSGDTIYVISRTGNNVQIEREKNDQSTANHSCSIIFAARLAFEDVDATYRKWESARKNKKG